jgi:hypothetical protein
MHRMLLPDPIYRQFAQMADGIRRVLGEKRWSDAECISQLLGELQARRKADSLRVSGAAAPVAGGSAVPVDGDGRSRKIPAEIRRAALVRARFVCEFCKNRYGAEIHHVIPFCKGGTHDLHNLIVLCHGCHRKLHDDERRDAGVGTDACEPAADACAESVAPYGGDRSPPARAAEEEAEEEAVGEAEEEAVGEAVGEADGTSAGRSDDPPADAGGGNDGIDGDRPGGDRRGGDGPDGDDACGYRGRGDARITRIGERCAGGSSRAGRDLVPRSESDHAPDSPGRGRGSTARSPGSAPRVASG